MLEARGDQAYFAAVATVLQPLLPRSDARHTVDMGRDFTVSGGNKMGSSMSKSIEINQKWLGSQTLEISKWPILPETCGIA